MTPWILLVSCGALGTDVETLDEARLACLDTDGFVEVETKDCLPCNIEDYEITCNASAEGDTLTVSLGDTRALIDDIKECGPRRDEGDQ